MGSDSEIPQNAGKAKVFISYSRRDLAFADRLDAALKTRGFEPMIDRSEIYAFEDWWKRLQALIERADTIVFVLSPDAVASREALREVEYAASLNKRFAPIVCRRVEEAAIPEALRRLNFVFFDDAAQFEASADRLAEALRTDIDWIRKHTEYGEAARHWAAAGRPGGLQLRSPALEDAEHWIASRPASAPAPTGDTQAFIADSRRGATRRRNILTGSLAAGLVLALLLAGLAYWQREVAVQERQIAQQQRDRAERTLALATQTANGLVFDLAQKFRGIIGLPAATVKDILDRARNLQSQLLSSGETNPGLRRSQAAALHETANTLLTLGQTKEALSAAEQGREIMQALVAEQPANTDFQNTLAAIEAVAGDIKREQGDLSAALALYESDRTTLEKLTAADPDNSGWQDTLANAYFRIGDVQVAQGNLAAGLKSLQQSLAIRERVAQSKPDNAAWQRALSVAHGEIGDVQVTQGNLTAALASYQAALSITERLAKSNPDNSLYQDDLALAYGKIGEIQEAQGNLPAALGAFETALGVKERLAQTDSGNTRWQRQISVSQERIGEVQKSQGNLGAALIAYQTSLSVSMRLAKSDPANAGWQSDLGTAYNLVGNVQSAQGNLRRRADFLPGDVGYCRAPCQVGSKQRGVAARPGGRA